MTHSIQSRRLAVGLSAVTALTLGCGGSTTDDSGKLSVVATTTMIGDAAAIVGGERVNVITLCGPGVDPHLYKASEGDARRISNANIIFYNGLHLEAKLGDVLDALSSRIPTFAVAEAIPADMRLAVEGGGTSYDPHVWFDVSMWATAVARLVEAYIEVDPEHEAGYRERGDAYLAELAHLHTDVQTRIAGIPEIRRVLVTAHDAFGYFGRAYGMEVHGLQGVSTESKAGTADVQRLADFIAERRVPSVFVESSVPPRAIEAVQAAVRARGFDVAIGEELFSDAMGSPGTHADTYVGMVRHNVNAIVSALTPTEATVAHAP
jgi:manganese/zinc/iron transport system substrate-binding protein